MERNYDRKDLFIVPVATLRHGDVVRDFHTEAPAYGVVKQVGPTLVAVLWDGDDENHISTMPFKASGGKRADIVRARRKNEISTSEGKADDSWHYVIVSVEAYAHVQALIMVDEGENCSPELYKELLKAFDL